MPQNSKVNSEKKTFVCHLVLYFISYVIHYTLRVALCDLFFFCGQLFNPLNMLHKSDLMWNVPDNLRSTELNSLRNPAGRNRIIKYSEKV